MTKKPWPRGKPIPEFRSEAEEADFWYRTRFDDREADWKPLDEADVPGKARSTKDRRRYTVAVAVADVPKVRALARRRKLSESSLLSDLIRKALRARAK